MFKPHKVEIVEREKGEFVLTLEAPLEIVEPKLVKDSKGQKRYSNFGAGEMKPSSTGKTFKLWDLGKGDNFSCRHPLTGETLLFTARLTMGMSDHDERKQALMRYALERGQ